MAIPPGLGPGYRGFESPLSDNDLLAGKLGDSKRSPRRPEGRKRHHGRCRQGAEAAFQREKRGRTLEGESPLSD